MDAIISGEDVPYAADKFIYASCVWVARRCRERGGVPILCHPHWITGWQYNIADGLLDALLSSGEFDAFELIGGQSARENNMQTAFFADWRARGHSMPAVGASDSHGTIGCGLFDKLYSVVFAASREPEDIKAAIRAGRVCAVETYEDSVNYSVHGEYRLVAYTRFLIEHYFPRTRAVAAPEGALMREYLCGVDGAGEQLAARAGRTDDFYKSFFAK